MRRGKYELRGLWIPWSAAFAALLIAVVVLVYGFLRGSPKIVETASAETSAQDGSQEESADGWEATEGESEHDHGAEGHSHGEGEAHEEGIVEVPPDMMEPFGIASAPVQQGDLLVTLDLYGWVRPRPADLTEVSAPIAGIVESFLAVPGDLVESGSPLVTLRVPAALDWQKTILDSVNDQAQLKASRGLLTAEGRAQVIQLLGELRVAAADTARFEEELAMMEQAGGNAVPKKDINAKRGELRSAAALLEAKRSLALAYELSPEYVAGIESGKEPIQAPEGALPPDTRREVAQTEFKVRNALNEEKVASRNLVAFGFNHGLVEKLQNGVIEALTDVLTIRARGPGLVTQILAERQATLDAGAPILHTIDYRKVRVEVEVPEVDIDRVLKRASDQVRVDIPGLGDKTLMGRVVYFDTTVDQDVRKAHLIVELDNLEGMVLRDRMAATVGVPLEIKKNTLSVPKGSIITDGFQKIVFLDEGDLFHRTVVKTGIETRDAVEVLEGVSPEDKVAVSGTRSLYLALSIPKGGGDAHAGHAH